MKQFWFDLATVVVIFAIMSLFSVVMYLGGSGNGYINGYCTALGGTVLNGSACNVDGKVVGVR